MVAHKILFLMVVKSMIVIIERRSGTILRRLHYKLFYKPLNQSFSLLMFDSSFPRNEMIVCSTIWYCQQ